MRALIPLVALVLVAMTDPSNAQDKGVIGEYQEDGFPVVIKLVNEMPIETTRAKYSWLTVISWKYDRNLRNGMPPAQTNEQMLTLEHAIEDHIESKGYCKHAYSRTGNGLKELVYHITDRDKFMERFNDALANQPRFPIEITFYEDKEWEDFQKILERFKQSG